jgi:hypothetical protein
VEDDNDWMKDFEPEPEPEPAPEKKARPAVPKEASAGLGDVWRRYGALIAAAAVVIVILGGYAVFRLAPPKGPDLATPEATVRSLVSYLRASDTDTKTYEPFFVDQVVAGAIAQSVGQGAFPKALDVDTIKAETGSDTATVTVKWTIRRPNVKENGSVFFLKLSGGRWRIVDARSKEVPSGAGSPKGKESTTAP